MIEGKQVVFYTSDLKDSGFLGDKDTIFCLTWNTSIFCDRYDYTEDQALARATCAIFQLRFHSHLFIHITSLRNLHNDLSGIQNKESVRYKIMNHLVHVKLQFYLN